MEEIVKALLEQNARLTDQIVELAKALAETKEPAPVYEPAVFRQYPLNVPEDEEDARAAFAAGEITKEQLEEALRELEFFNTEITIPSA